MATLQERLRQMGVSETTLIEDEEFDTIESKKQNYNPIREELSSSFEELHGEIGETAESEAGSEDGYYYPAHIHLLKLGDTIQSIAKQYNSMVHLIERANRFSQITEDITDKRKFVVIPSKSTFREFILEGDQETYELCLNFQLLFRGTSLDDAEMQLAKSNYNLALAVENYHFDIV
ncbi:hypothetical protein BC833DRAFT_657757 [Globomyces pollinis-pini]|nr:hypothetical protein BC833DRAFT_657757 [Globomyces pollinis-pini]